MNARTGTLRRMLLCLVIVTSGLLCVAPWPAGATAAQAQPSGASGREELSINFGDYQSSAELTYPAGASGPLPTVILIPGSGPEDKDAAIFSPFGSPSGSRTELSHNFSDIADALTPQGYAVLRYDKHYVTGPGQADEQRFATLDLQQMLADAEQVLATAKADPHVDSSRIFLYGWSEGSVIGAALAARHPEIAGLILQGPVAVPWRQIFLYQFEDVGLPYLRSFAPDGMVTAATLHDAGAGSGGLVAKELLAFLIDPNSFTGGSLAVNPALDTNGDGVLSIDDEIAPALPGLIDAAFQPGGFFAIYAPDRALPTVTEQAANLAIPVLILQGANDANVPPRGAWKLARALGDAGNQDYQVNLYGGLGHSLGPATSLIDDNFRPIAPAPLADTAAWLNLHAGVQEGHRENPQSARRTASR